MPYRALDPSTAAAAPVTTAGMYLGAAVDGGLTMNQLKTELTFELGARANLDPTRLALWINWAYKNLAGMLKLNELKADITFSLVPNQPFYLLPSVVRSIIGASLIDPYNYPYQGGTVLIKGDEDEYKRQKDSSLLGYSVGPTRYFRYGRMLVVYPDPVTAVSLVASCYIRPVDIPANSDFTPLLPPEFHEAILLHAKYKAYRSLQEFEKAQVAENSFHQVIRPLIDTDGEESDDEPRGMTVVKKVSDLYRLRR